MSGEELGTQQGSILVHHAEVAISTPTPAHYPLPLGSIPVSLFAAFVWRVGVSRGPRCSSRVSSALTSSRRFVQVYVAQKRMSACVRVRCVSARVVLASALAVAKKCFNLP